MPNVQTPERFKETYTLSIHTEKEVALQRAPFLSVWEALSDCPRLGSLADIHEGVQYKARRLSECVFDEPQPDFVPGVATPERYMEPYLISDYQYLSTNPQNMRDSAYKQHWDRPKVLVNRIPAGRDYWHIAGSVDYQGLWAAQQFYGVWPKDNTPLELLAAVICGPVANAYLFPYHTGRDNQIGCLEQIPVPRFTEEQAALVVSLVQDYYSQRGQWLAEPERSSHYEGRCRELLYQIDAAVLEAYALPADLERRLLADFDGAERRPLPFSFPGYGEEYERAKETLQREKAYRALLKQYHAMVDKKYRMGLTPEECEEMERLGRAVDAYNAPFYERIFEALGINKE